MHSWQHIILVFIGVFTTGLDAAPKKSGSVRTQNEIEWPKFNASDVDGNELVEYSIGWLPKTKYEEALDLMVEYMYRDNPYVMAFDWADDEETLDLNRSNWMEHLRQGMSIACFKKGSTQLIGVNILYIEKHDPDYVDPETPVKYPKDTPAEYKNLMKLTREIETVQKFNVFDKYGVTEYLASSGLVVRPEYRRRGIAKQLLAVRKSICMKYNLKVTSTVFTSNASNELAIEAGFQFDKSKMYKDIFANLPEKYQTDMTDKPKEFARRSIKYFD